MANMYAFGSALRDAFRSGESDIDRLVDSGDMDGYTKAHAYFDLLDELEEVLGAKVDLVMAHPIVGFRNVLTHDYSAIDDETACGVALTGLQQLRRECADLLADLLEDL